MVTSGRLAVYEKPKAPFELKRFPIRPPRAGELLVKIRMSTICRSDIHSYLGHRPNPCPGVLGHEIIGDVVALGSDIKRDMRGDPLQVGDRITWSEYFIPGPSYYTEVLDLPQKSPGVDKYGHMAVTTEPHHHGGFGEYCYILPRSWILKLPDGTIGVSRASLERAELNLQAALALAPGNEEAKRELAKVQQELKK